jgi:hypothetical protein
LLELVTPFLPTTALIGVGLISSHFELVL